LGEFYRGYADGAGTFTKTSGEKLKGKWNYGKFDGEPSWT
jgi:hypothetical protein